MSCWSVAVAMWEVKNTMLPSAIFCNQRKTNLQYEY